jgi:DNA-nicking Smr family endonuclease
MRSRRERLPTEAELQLWAEVARSVRPFAGRKLLPPPQPPGDEPQPDRTTPAPAVPHPPKPAVKPLAPIERRTLTALKRGQQPLEGVLDLHGLRQDEAHSRLRAFLRSSQARGSTLVLVVTGKGAAGETGFGDAMFGAERGVLRRVVPHWLRMADLRGIVLGFEEAALRHGGAGALYVRLRRAREGLGA